MLDAHANQLAGAAMRSLEQARQVVNAAARDLEGWDTSTEQALRRFRETLVLRIMDAVNRKVSTLGHRFAKDAEWHDFDTTECRNIARKAVDEFLEEQRSALRVWEDKLRLFSDSMDAFSRECLERLSASIDGLQDDPGDAPGSSSAATHFLVQTHRHMRNLAVFATGMSVGRLTALGPISLLVTAGNILALAAASPVAAAVFAAVAGTAGLLYHLGREDRRRAAFLERRRKEAELYADRIVEALRQELGEVRGELGKAYEFEIRRGFAPALESLFLQSVHLKPRRSMSRIPGLGTFPPPSDTMSMKRRSPGNGKIRQHEGRPAREDQGPTRHAWTRPGDRPVKPAGRRPCSAGVTGK